MNSPTLPVLLVATIGFAACYDHDPISPHRSEMRAVPEGIRPAFSASSNVLTAKLMPQAFLLDAGGAVQIGIKVRCDAAVGHVLKAFVYVTQNGIQSRFAPLPLVCDGKHAHYKVRVPADADSPPFARGDGRASAYILQERGSTETISVGDTRAIRIR